MEYGLPWDTNRVDGCICPCNACIEGVGYDPEIPCPRCPVAHK